MSHLLQAIPLFASLSDEELGELETLLRPREYGPNQTIIWIGEPGEEMFVVKSGQVVISCPGETQAEVILGILRPGSFFGELSLLDGGPRTATGRSKEEPVVLLALERKDFYAFLEKHPRAGIHILQVLSQRQREMVDRVRGIKNVNEAVDERTTRFSRAAEKIAEFGASQYFLLANLVLIVGWVIAQVVLYKKPVQWVDDPPTFFTLCFIMGLQSFMLTMFVLNTQKRQGERDRVRADVEYQVNLKAHHEIMQLHRKIDRIEAALNGGGAAGHSPPLPRE